MAGDDSCGARLGALPDELNHCGSTGAATIGSTASPWYWSRWEALGWIILVGVLVGVFPFVVHRTTRLTSNDFWQFYNSAQYVWQHGTRAPDSKFLSYLPSIDIVAYGLVAWMPMRWAAAAWFGIMIAGWLGLLAAVRRYLLADCDPTQARQSLLAAALLVLPLFLDHLCVGAFHVLMVWLMVAGLGRVGQNRSWSGGLMLGLAIWIKLLPLVGVAYLLLKRKWLPASLAFATAVAVDLAITLSVLGPEPTLQTHVQWWRIQGSGAQHRILNNADPIDEDRLTNQSLAILLRHLLTRMGHGSDADRDTAAQLGITLRPWEVGSVDYGGLRPNVTLADLTPGELQAVYGSIVLLLMLGIAFYCRHPGRDTSTGQGSREIALVVLATLWFSPLVWSYHPTAALPALAVILSRSPERPRLTQATAVWWIVSMALMGWPWARAVGVTLWTNLLLGVVLLRTAPKIAAEELPKER